MEKWEEERIREYCKTIGIVLIILALAFFAVAITSAQTTSKEDAILKLTPYLTDEQLSTLAENNNTGVPIPDDCGYWGVSGAWHPYANCISYTENITLVTTNQSDRPQTQIEKNCAEAVDCSLCLREKYDFGSYFNPCELCARTWMGMFVEGCACCNARGGS